MDLLYDTAICNYFWYETIQEENQIPANNVYFSIDRDFSFKAQTSLFSTMHF